MTQLASLSPIGKVGRYDLVGRLASGGMAEIFLARESGPRTVQRHLVVKRILPHIADDERLVEMFVQEARVCMHLSHPHICPIYEFGDGGGGFFLAMEWVRGISLRELIGEVEGPLPIAFVVKVVADIAGALHHAHVCTDDSGRRLSIVHRDVNPENVMIGFDGVAKLLDFGVAKATSQKQKTEAGTLKGKFAYISPEQYQGQPLDGRSDVFSLGVSLFEALTGKSLYDRASEYETVAAIVLDPTVPSVREARPDVPAALDEIVARAMAKDRDHRYLTADALQAALLDFLSEWGHKMRHADVAATLRELVPGRVDAEPKLDRRAPTMSGKWPAQAPAPAPPPSNPLDSLALLEAADQETEALLGAQRRSSRAFVWISLLVILASLGVVGWVATRPRDAQPVEVGADSDPAPPPPAERPGGDPDEG